MQSFPAQEGFECVTQGLFDYDKNHNHDSFGWYWDDDYSTRLFTVEL